MKDKELRGLIGRQVDVRGGNGLAFVGKLLGKLDVWRDARPDLVTPANRHTKLWTAIADRGAGFEEIHFDASCVDVSLAV